MTSVQLYHHTFSPWCVDGDRRIVSSETAWKTPAKLNRLAVKFDMRYRLLVDVDVFEDWHGPMVDAADVRSRLFDLIDATPHLDWLLVTKRPDNIEFILRTTYTPYLLGLWHQMERGGYQNVWLGTSIENQVAADDRIPHLLRVPAAVRFLSCEPLLGPADLSAWLFCDRCRGPHACGPGAYETPLDNAAGGCWFRECRCSEIGWVIAAGESGPGARPCHLDWMRSIVRQCRDAGVACFVKQLGSAAEHTVVVPHDGNYTSETQPHALRDPKGGNWNEWPEDLRVREFPSAGRSDLG